MSISGGYKAKALKGFTGRDSKTYVADGAVSLSADTVILDGTDATCTMTLADGADGQRMSVVCLDSTNACKVTPANFTDGVDLTFTVGEVADLIFAGGAWVALSYTAALA